MCVRGREREFNYPSMYIRTYITTCDELKLTKFDLTCLGLGCAKVSHLAKGMERLKALKRFCSLFSWHIRKEFGT